MIARLLGAQRVASCACRAHAEMAELALSAGSAAMPTAVMVVRAALLLVHTISFLFCTVLAVVATPPSKHERVAGGEIRRVARQRCGVAAEALTKALQHLTVCTGLGHVVVSQHRSSLRFFYVKMLIGCS